MTIKTQAVYKLPAGATNAGRLRPALVLSINEPPLGGTIRADLIVYGDQSGATPDGPDYPDTGRRLYNVVLDTVSPLNRGKWRWEWETGGES